MFLVIIHCQVITHCQVWWEYCHCFLPAGATFWWAAVMKSCPLAGETHVQGVVLRRG